MPLAEPSVPLLSASGISKGFPGVQALSGVSIEVHAGEVLALIGENGAGKSTLMKILGGIYQPDSGEIRLRGVPVRFRSVQESLAAGITIIHQELNLADNLSVAENIFLGRQPRRGPFGLRDRRLLLELSEKALALVGLRVSPRTILGDLSPGQKQLVEIAKALSRDACLLVFDEPTSSLSTSEAE
ncbi:MAG TPA: ATP-binding cassette domain-containing protein, partial [Planctomycetota bacterium]|nr:ATP-binding cassette domain-containing protein [Planctomycetota bacterium]